MYSEGLIAKWCVLQLVDDKTVHVHLMEEGEGPILMHVEFDHCSFKFIFSFPLEQSVYSQQKNFGNTYSSSCLDL